MTDEEKKEIQKTKSTDLIMKVRNYICFQSATKHNELVIACFDELIQRGLKAERRVTALTEKLHSACVLLRNRRDELRKELTKDGVLP